MQLKETIMSNDVAVVNTYIQEGNLSKLLSLPNFIDDFSETSIIKCVECFLKATEEQMEEVTKLAPTVLSSCLPWLKEGVKSPFSSSKCYALNKMLQQKFSSQFLQEAARMMSFDCVLALTKYLHFLLCWAPVQKESDQVVPSFEQIIDWLNALLDSHFQQLQLAEDASSILNSLLELVTGMAKSQVESKTLQGMLKELIQQFEKQQKNAEIGNYCIEVISF